MKNYLIWIVVAIVVILLGAGQFYRKKNPLERLKAAYPEGAGFRSLPQGNAAKPAAPTPPIPMQEVGTLRYPPALFFPAGDAAEKALITDALKDMEATITNAAARPKPAVDSAKDTGAESTPSKD